jgi:hypothetical protein|tara:strand:+ start:1298 stop:1510 length:213 start_codon:yes stop_codon:yes gene_type:complete
MLSKQSIRGTTQIFMNQKLVEGKDTIISESESWTEEEEVFFKKMLRQGGKFSIGGRKYFIIPNANNSSLD